MTRRPAIIDTNVVVAGVLSPELDSPPARIMSAMLTAEFPFLLSIELLGEYRRVLLRDRIRAAHGLSDDEVDRILTEIALNTIVIEPEEQTPEAPDAGDQHLWDLLGALPGAVLVTGNRRLLEASTAERSIVSPRTFVGLPGWK